jgi:thiol-disulfide isomerase/thioredoxin
MSAPSPPGSAELLVFTAPGCSLCDKALADLAPLATELGFAVRLVDIAGDPDLEARYRGRIPVGELGGRVVFKFELDEARLRRVWAEMIGRGRGRGRGRAP